jgi:PKHD-type hydroxylase
MFKEIPNLITPQQVQALRQLAANSKFVDGRISNPESPVKNNQQLYDGHAADGLAKSLYASEDFVNFAFPITISPPLISRYVPGMHYGLHADAAYLPFGDKGIRCDLSCTIFLSDPDSYEGGALRVELGDRDVRFRLPPGSAIVYPSSMMHEVEPVTRGERLAGITFIQSRVADQVRRELLYELNEIAALEGLRMDRANYTRLQLVQRNLLHHWGDMP